LSFNFKQSIPMKKPMYLLLGLLLAACQSDPNKLDPETELSAQIDGQTWSARPTATRSSTVSMSVLGNQGGKGQLVVVIQGGSALFKPFTAELHAPGMEVLKPSAMQESGALSPDTFWASIMYTNTETGESWASMRPAEGSAGQLVVTKADRNSLEGEFSGTLWGPIRLGSEDWKDSRNLRPLRVEKGVVRLAE
jgi:hypothetical protein